MAQRRGPVRRTQPASESSSRVAPVLPFTVTWALLIARWLVPTEASGEGETLWLTSLTLFGAAVVYWSRVRSSSESTDQAPPRLTGLDGSVVLLCGSHIIASAGVLLSGGQRRAALNFGWEWTATLVLYFLLRHSCRSPSRSTLICGVTAVWMALAGYGLWQHTVWYPATVQAYEQTRDRYESAVRESASPNAPPSARRTLQAAAAELTADGIPLNGPARELFERRLRDSREPFGFFALANSFAGGLSVIVVLLCTLLISEAVPVLPGSATPEGHASGGQPADVRKGCGSTSPSRRFSSLLAAVLITTACLLLTKSRTAWCGTVAGLSLAVSLLLFTSRNSARARRLVLPAGGFLAFAGVLTTIAVLTGSLDVNVLREAPKSLKYRLEYWTGTAAVIREQPLLGVGPGQFRDAYLKHKLPESSEEIADPHQAFLDVWANAGLPALAGLIGVIVFSIRNIRQKLKDAVRPKATAMRAAGNPPDTASKAGLYAILAGFGTVLAASLILEARLDLHVLSVGVGAALCWWLIKDWFLPADPDAQQTSLPDPNLKLLIGVSGGLCALLIHLQGAGGIGMPAIHGLLLLLALQTSPAADPAGPPASPQGDRRRESLRMTAAVTAAGLSVACSLTGFVPDQSRRALLAAGDFELSRGGSLPQAERLYREAASVDVLSPAPWLRLSEVAFRQWSRSGNASDFERATVAAAEAIARSPATASLKQHVGRWFLQRAEQENSVELAARAATWLERAVAGYPTEPQWLAELARARQLAADSAGAADAAQRALRFDQLNRSAGHVDRYLHEEMVRDLQSIVEAASPSGSPLQ